MENSEMRVGAVTNIKEAKILKMPLPEIHDDEVLVRIHTCALCTFEQRIFTGEKKVSLPNVGGHEVAGSIARVGKSVDSKWKVGQKVALRTFTRCNECHYCHTGEDTMCNGFVDHHQQIPGIEGIGGLSDYFVCKPSILFPLDNHVDLTNACLIEPLSCVLHSIDSAKIEFGDTVVVVGSGIMGLLHVQLAKLRGARVIMVDPNQERLDKSLSFGVDYKINPINEDLVSKIKEITNGLGADAIIYTPPVTKLVSEYLKVCAKGARFVLYGSFHPDEPALITLNQIHYNQIQLVGVVNPGTRDFERAVRMVNYKIIDLSRYVDEVYSFEQVQDAYVSATTGGKYRVVISLVSNE